jgi:type VI secretion system protein ImpA
MASPTVLDFERLLAPIDGEPTGTNLREDSSPSSLYQKIKDARSAARAAERQAAKGEDVAPPDWRSVIRHGETALVKHTKDLEIVAFMIEGLLRLNGFAGLRDGFKLASGLVERYWDDLYPKPDEDGLETRLAALINLNGADAEGTLIAPIAQVPLTEGSSVGPFAGYQYQMASDLAQVVDEEAREKRAQQGAITLTMIERAVGETPTPFFVNLVEDLKQCQAEYEALGRVLEERCQDKAPPSSNIRGALATCLDTVKSIARNKLPVMVEPTADGEAGAAAGDGAAADGGGQPGAPGSLRSRDDALQMLLKVADYFRRAEPHTPVSYALEQAVRWGRMSLPELLNDLIPDDSARQAFFHRVGIRPDGEGG